MQVTETLSEGLKREYSIVLSADDLGRRLDGQLAQMKEKVRLNGFRPGKVPAAHLKKVYGKSVMAETIDETVKDTNNKIFTDHGFKLADFKSFAVTRPVVDVSDADVDEAINRIVEQNRPFADKGAGAKAAA